MDTDAATDVVVLVSKPPAASVRDEVIGVADKLSKPVVAILLGERAEAEVEGNVHYARTLEETARVAVELAGTRSSRPVALRPEQRWIKALYTGGTLASEAAMLLEDSLGLTASTGHRHEVIDLGDDVYTRGRPHPMIDPSSRTERIAAVFDDPENAVLLLDVVLGHGADPDPAGALAAVIVDGLARLHADGRDLAVVASVCGTEEDPQSSSAQTLMLEQAGVAVLPSNAAAVRHAVAILQRREHRRSPRRPHPSRSVGCCRNRRGSSTSVCGSSPIPWSDLGAQVVHYDWRPVAGGDPKLQALIDALS